MTPDDLIDPATGLFGEQLLRAILPSRIATARRALRQLGLIVVDCGALASPVETGRMVALTIRDSDIAARLSDGTVAVALEFTPVDGCRVVVDRLRRKLAAADPPTPLTAGIACYPAQAIDHTELLAAARLALLAAPLGGTAVAPVPV